MADLQTKNQHLMWRAGFGPSAAQLDYLPKISSSALYAALKKSSSGKPEYIDVADNYLKGLFMGAGEIGRQQRQQMNVAEKKKQREQNRDDIKSLNLAWLDEMVHSEAQLREKMAFFWHGHFASRNLNIFYQQQLLDIIRENALGSFRTLLHEASKSAAILNFLNAQQNRKDHPNENFAREVMELFTLGRGHYSEHDVKEAARAFTGWGANAKGEFVFRKFQHDTGNKTVLGYTGRLVGEDVLDLLLEQKQTAFFITEKIYRFFVNEITDTEKVKWLSTRFYESDYNIEKLMDDIFSSTWFYEDKNIGKKIKSPIELLVGIQRMLPMKLQEPESLLVIQRLLGQLLFYPPNVAGWPSGKAWIDSSILMMRLRIPQLLTSNDNLDIQPKTDDDQMMGKNDAINRKGRSGKIIKTEIDWNQVSDHFSRFSNDSVQYVIVKGLLQVPMKSPAILKKDTFNKDHNIKLAFIQIMSLPEYQLC